jgi:hypothetical protein
MDQAAYTTARDATTSMLISCWLRYCTQPEEALFRQFTLLQHRLELAALHARELNYAAAVHALPPLPLTFNALSAQWPSPN